MGNLFQQFINGDFDSSTSSDEHEMTILGALEHERIERERTNHGERSRRLLRNKKKKRKGGKTRDCFHIGETTLFAASDIHSVMADPPRHTCLKLEISNNSIFIKATWFQTHFHLSITDGLDAWICNASEAEVKERATQWDQPLSEYLQLAERYLGFQQPGSVYGFADAGDGHKRLSWTFEKEGTKLEWRWKCQLSPNSKLTTAGILDFLMDANIRLSEEVVRKSQSFEKLKVEAEKCLAQSEKFSSEKAEFESAIYAKFLGVLNSKKAKLRELQEQLSKQETAGKMPQEDEEFTDKTESFDDESDDEKSEEEPTKNPTGTSKAVPASRLRGRKRITRK